MQNDILKKKASEHLKHLNISLIMLQVDVLGEEVCRVKGESGERVRVLEGRVEELTERLSVYQRMESDMDDVILQAAQGE